MAALSENDRVEVWADYMRRNVDAIGITKQDLRAALDATDQWIDDNASAYNTALPVAARTGLAARQKALLFMYVAAKRFGVL